MIKEIVVKGKDVYVRYESEVWKCYRKQSDIPQGLSGVRPIPNTVVRFMRQYPNKVR